ncbi:LysM peptidoglycan-binding domain-containing protein [Robertmurraya korlensis]|uniref:C40 family peptidase n=1 Tax=Robertmurraya korlensis TaxID=519977 RepID=UPI00203A965A|nr:peptidoglycan endopeptidase [Robertmurraya korlensis]MCM3602182.1 LysM peptidoglycan-binding domain-containing protein [Robertmurraya korlensis]
MKKKVVSLTSAVLLTSTFATNTLASTYTVQKGDTLTRIATKYNTTVPAIKSLNNLSSNMIYINQVLKVDESTTPTQPVQAPTVTQVKYHTVASGDSLSKIASMYKISLSDLRKWNNQNSDLIYPGQKFIVSNPSNTTSTPVVTPAPSTSAPTTPVAENTAAEYVVKSGDYLGKIATQYKLTVQELKTLNGLQSDMIYVGQKLKVSKTATPATPETSPTTNVDPVVETSKTLLGIPYVWGGNTPEGFDCSGFIYYVFNQAGTKIGRYSAEGYYSRSYYVDKPQVGDLLFFENTYKAGISHMGIYIGNNEFIHADAKGVVITNLNNTYYKERFDGYKRFY